MKKYEKIIFLSIAITVILGQSIRLVFNHLPFEIQFYIVFNDLVWYVISRLVEIASGLAILLGFMLIYDVAKAKEVVID